MSMRIDLYDSELYLVMTMTMTTTM